MSTRRPPIHVAAFVAAAMLLAACDGAPRARIVEGADATAAAPASSSAPPSAGPDPAAADPTVDATAPDPSAPAPSAPAPDERAPDDEPRRSLESVGHGDRGDAVEAVQRRLADVGYEPGAVDGVYGPRTADAITAYQHAADLEATGAADDATVDALAAGDHAFVVLQPGDRGTAVRAVQQTLADGPFDPGPVDGVYGTKTVQAVYALEKAAGLVVDGAWDGTDVQALQRLEAGEAEGAQEGHDRRWVEVDLSRQLMSVYEAGSPGTPALVSHVSTGNGRRWCNDTAGCRVASTPTGSFTIDRRIAGWRESSLDIGRLYNPLYFRGGIALHGALSVPTHPASHGCVRVPMHIAEYLPDLLPDGTPVEIVA